MSGLFDGQRALENRETGNQEGFQNKTLLDNYDEKGKELIFILIYKNTLMGGENFVETSSFLVNGVGSSNRV